MVLTEFFFLLFGVLQAVVLLLNLFIFFTIGSPVKSWVFNISLFLSTLFSFSMLWLIECILKKLDEENEKSLDESEANAGGKTSGAWILVKESWFMLTDNLEVYTPIFLIYLVPALILNVIEVVFPIPINPEDVFQGYLSYRLPGIILGYLLLNFASICIIYATKQIHKKNTPGYKDSFNVGVQKFIKYNIQSILIFILLIPLFLLFIIPGVIFSFYWVFAGIILVSEDKPIIQSIKQSKKTVEGRWMKLFGILFGALIILTIPTIIIDLLAAIPSTILNILNASPIYAKIMEIITTTLTTTTNSIPSLLYTLILTNLYLQTKRKK